MTKYKLEYIWLDGYTPTPSLRGKTQIKEFASFPTLEQLPLWGFDGSSTQQAEGHSSDCVLKPVACYPDAARENGVLVMIRKLRSGEYRLYSRKVNPKTGKRRNLGTFKSRTAAEKHERDVQYFKRH